MFCVRIRPDSGGVIMVERDFYLKLKRVLESELYTERLLERTGLDPEENARRNLLLKPCIF